MAPCLRGTSRSLAESWARFLNRSREQKLLYITTSTYHARQIVPPDVLSHRASHYTVGEELVSTYPEQMSNRHAGNAPDCSSWHATLRFHSITLTTAMLKRAIVGAFSL